MLQLAAIIELVTKTVPGLLALISRAMAAAKANDQATLDALHTQAVAAAEALKPSDA